MTREHVHLDRVACPWLIRRFIDPQAEFVFVPWGKEDQRPSDAIPFSIPGAELGPHDEQGTTFDKFLLKYNLDDPALAEMSRVIASGVHQALHKGRTDEFEVPALKGIGMNAFSEGMMLISDEDQDNVDRSMVFYDAIYAWCRLRIAVKGNADLAGKGFMEQVRLIKGAIQRASRG